MLKNVNPNEALIEIFKAISADAWGQPSAQLTTLKSTFCKELTMLERKIDGFLDKTADATSPHVTRACKCKIENWKQNS